MARSRKQAEPEALSPEHDADAAVAAAAIDGKAASKKTAAKRKPAPRTPRETVERIVELRKEGKGLTTIKNTLNADGITTATGKEWREQQAPPGSANRRPFLPGYTRGFSTARVRSTVSPSAKRTRTACMRFPSRPK
jgi:hypothetical protein